MQWQIHGHEWAVNLLKSHAQGEKLRHAYLLTGPEGVGRRTLALRFAQALNCDSPPKPGEFCNNCKACRQLQNQAHPDLSILQPEEGHKDILIDQVRELQHILALAPYVAHYRIALLPDFQRATTQAANALLKTLEEPPDRVILILTADAIESLLPTIVSRCETMRLRPVAISSAQTYLETHQGLSEEKALLLAHLSGGRIGFAIRLATNPTMLARRTEIVEDFLTLLPANRRERFKLADKLSSPYDKAREQVREVLPVWLSFWRDVFTRATEANTPLVNVDYELDINRIAKTVDEKSARYLVLTHEKAIQQLDAYANVRLLIENLLLQWPKIG